MTELDLSQRRVIRKLLMDCLAASDELMAEFISKKRAAHWGVINRALYNAEQFLRKLPKD